jgi:hypothetical protein
MQSSLELSDMHQIGTPTLPCPARSHSVQTPSQSRESGLHTGEGVQVRSKKTIYDLIEEICGDYAAAEGGRKDVIGYVKCPGQHLHTHETAHRDAAIVLPPNSLPVIKCFHNSCREHVSALSEVLRMRVEDAVLGREVDFEWTPGSEEQMQIWGAGKDAELAAKNKMPEVMCCPWGVDSIVGQSPVQIPDSGDLQGRLLLSLFGEDDIVWIGDPWHSGKPKHASHFRSAGEWKALGVSGWNSYITGSTYLPGAFSRGNGAVLQRKFLIAESDCLEKAQMGGVFRYVSSIGYKLRAVVDSGRKSLHGWFDLDGIDAECVSILEGMLRGFGMDAKTMRAAQPVRMAGVQRELAEGKTSQQSLLYLDPA